MAASSSKPTAYRKLHLPDDQELHNLFQSFISRGIIELDDVIGSDEEAIMKTILDKVHKYSISRAKNGQFVTYVRDETQPTGRRQVRKATKKELYRYLLEFYGISDKNAPGAMRYGELYHDWVDYKRQFIDAPNKKKGLSPTTIRRYERDYDNYIKGTKLDKLPIHALTPVTLERLVVDIIENRELTDRCAGNLIGYIHQSFQYARRSRYISEDPSEYIDRTLILSRCRSAAPKPDEERVLTISELTMLLDAVQAHEAKHPDYMPDYAIELSSMTGMRVGELAALKWTSVDEDFIHVDYSEHRLDYADRPSELVIGEPKNQKHRLIPCTEGMRILFEKIRALGMTSEEGYIFVREDGSRYTGHDIGCALDRRAREAGIKKTSIHGIRRTVSSYLNQTLPTRTVANMLGHLPQTNEACYQYDMSEKADKIRALDSLSSFIIKKSA